MHSIARAAHLTQTSEYKILSEAYLYRYGDRPNDDEISELFARLMMFGEVPEWADKFAKDVVTEVSANRKVNLNSYCLLNLSPRVGRDKSAVTFNIVT